MAYSPITNPMPVTGNIAAGSTDSGNPVKVGGRVISQANKPILTAGNRTDALFDLIGNLQVVNGGQYVTAMSNQTPAYVNGTAQDNNGLNAPQSVLSFVYNGGTIDAVRGMGANSTTGDTGAKTATGTGANLTNVGNTGVQILIALGTVSGTTPTAVFKVQGSVDGGATFFDTPGATTASLTATGNFGIMVYPGIAVTAGTTTTGTTATANMVLPRTWRLVWAIGGTTPSFTITNIQYNYLVN